MANKEKTGEIRNEKNDKISIQSGTHKIVKKFWRGEEKKLSVELRIFIKISAILGIQIMVIFHEAIFLEQM